MVTEVVKQVARVPVWCKLTPSTTDIVAEARASFLGGADAIVSSNTFPSIPLINPDTLEFEVNVGVPVPREPFSFGGWNESRFGVGDITGRGSIEFWTQSKKMTTKWNREHGTNWMS